MAVKKQVIIDVDIVGDDAVDQLNANLKKTQTNANNADTAIDNLNTSLKDTESSNADATIDDLNDSLQKTATDAKNADTALDKMDGTTKKATTSSDSLTTSITSNGGAMAILDKLTFGYATVLKDALEASKLFSTTTKAGTTVIAAETTARGANTTVTTASTVATGVNTAAGVTATATNTAETASLATLTASKLAATVATEAAAKATVVATKTTDHWQGIINLATDSLKRMAAGTALTSEQTIFLTKHAKLQGKTLKETAKAILAGTTSSVKAAKDAATASTNAARQANTLAKAHKATGTAARLAGLVTRKALIATGIGAFIVALGFVVAYWEDIVNLVTGVNTELQKQISASKILLGLTNDRLDILRAEEKLLEGRGQETLDNLADQITETEKLITRKDELRVQRMQELEDLQNEATAVFWLTGQRSKASEEEKQAIAEKRGEVSQLTKEIIEANTELDRLREALFNPKTTPGPATDTKDRTLVPIPEGVTSEAIITESDLRKELEEDFTEFLAGQSKKRAELTEAELAIIRDIRLDNQLLVLDGAASTFASLAQMSEDNSDLQKGFAITSVLIDTAAAIIGTWRGYAQFGPWGTAAAIAQTVAITAAGAAQIANITSAGPGGSIDAPSGGSTPAPPTAQSQQTLTNSINAQNQVPVRAYLVSSDIETQLALDRQISNNSKLGNT